MLSYNELEKYKARIKPQNSVRVLKAEIGQNLRRMRDKTGLKQEDVCEILGLSRRSISRYENGETGCSLEQLIIFCQLYECKLDDLLPKEMAPYVSELHGLGDQLLTFQSAFASIVERAM